MEARVIATLNAADDAKEQVCAVTPSREEVRMVRATAFLAVAEAARKGTCHASFRGFYIAATRQPCGDVGRALVRVELVVRLSGHMIDRETVELLPMHFA